MQGVERSVAVDHPRDESAVALDESFDRESYLLFRKPTHCEQPTLQLFELRLKVSDALVCRRHYPNLPVMWFSVSFAAGAVNIGGVAPHSTSLPSQKNAVTSDTRA